MSTEKIYDVLPFGRSSIDLYSNDIGAPFEEITSFGAFVGGLAANIAVSCARLGLNAGLLTAVGKDKVGDFILRFLRNEGIETKFIPVIEGTRSSAVVLGIEPPDRFPLVFYRNNAADINIDIDHLLRIPLEQFKVIVLSGTAMSKDPSRMATLLAAERAKAAGAAVFMDLDFRADQWADPRYYGIMVRAILPKVDVAIGTEEEILAISLQHQDQIKIAHQQISAPEIAGNVEEAIKKVLDTGVQTLIVKRGPKGASIYQRNKERVDIPGFPVQVINVLGAGDAFAGGLIYGYVKGFSFPEAVRIANACGAFMVTQQGCANFMPTYDQITQFIKEYEESNQQ